MRAFRRPFRPFPLLATALPVLVAATAAAQAPTPPPAPSGPRAGEPQSAPPVEEPDLNRAGVQLADLMVPGGMTSDAAAHRAVETAPSIEQARASAVQAEAAADEAWLGVLPRLDLTASYTRLSDVTYPSLVTPLTDAQAAQLDALVAGVDDPEAQQLWQGQIMQQKQLGEFSFPVILNQYLFRAQVSYPVTDLFLTILPSYRAAKTAAEAQQAQVDVTQASVALDAREAFYQYARAKGALLVAEASLAQAQSQQKQVDSLVAAGAAARVESLRVKARVASAKVAVARARGSVSVAARALETLLHLPPDGSIDIGEDLSDMPPAVTEDAQTLVARAKDQRPEIESVKLLVDARKRQARARAGQQWPHVVVQGGYDYARPNQRIIPQRDQFDGTWQVGAALTWSPNDFLTARAQADQASAQAMKAEADLRQLEDGIEVEVIQSYEGLATARQAFEAAQAGIDAAEETYRVRFQQLQAGAAVTTDLVDADAELTRARLELLDAAIDVHLAYARLMRAVTGKAEF